MITHGFKLFRLRKDGTLGPLFINRRQVVSVGIWWDAESHPTKGYAVRPGWHACATKSAPHLSERGRVWCEVELQGVTEHQRPAAQGGLWYTADWLRVVKIIKNDEK